MNSAKSVEWTIDFNKTETTKMKAILLKKRDPDLPEATRLKINQMVCSLARECYTKGCVFSLSKDADWELKWDFNSTGTQVNWNMIPQLEIEPAQMRKFCDPFFR